MQNWYTKSDFWGTRNQPTNRFQLFFTNETCINENTSLLFYVYLVIKILFLHISARAAGGLSGTITIIIIIT